MANRKRGTFCLPEELRTNERLSTKKELAQRKSLPPCPTVPNKIRKSVLAVNGTFEKPKPVFFNNSVELSPTYDPSLDSSYFDQLYTSLSLIGEGSFGKVYRVRSRENNKIYAIKRLKSAISFKDRYAEVRNNEKVGIHPNCVQFFMAWEEGWEVYMLLEFCDMSLSDFSILNNDIPEELLWDVLLDMCKALVFLHSRDLLHLDVKPGNIMMKSGQYKLGDFGILVDLKLAPMTCKSTLSDGDSKYLALEVLEGIYKPSCDIFGLGISLLELAADLELPSHGPLWQQLRHEILPQNFYERVSLGFKIIIERMLKPEYDQRPSAEKILKYSTMKTIQKRDKKEPRIDFAAQFVNQDDYEDISLPFPIMLNNNNNIIDTPRCHSDYRHVSVPECHYSIRILGEDPSTLERKSLFHADNKKMSPSNGNHPMSTSEKKEYEMKEYLEALSHRARMDSPNITLSFDGDSILAVDLSDSNNSTDFLEVSDMDVSAEKLNNNNSDCAEPMPHGIITSTPILRCKHNRKIPKTKLSFD